MQNEPNLPSTQIFITSVTRKNYIKYTRLEHPKNEPNTNPIRTQSKPIYKILKMTITTFIISDYIKKGRFRPKKTNPISNPKRTQFYPKNSVLCHPSSVICSPSCLRFGTIYICYGASLLHNTVCPSLCLAEALCEGGSSLRQPSPPAINPIYAQGILTQKPTKIDKAIIMIFVGNSKAM